jgi:hypothetical protein
MKYLLLGVVGAMILVVIVGFALHRYDSPRFNQLKETITQ